MSSINFRDLPENPNRCGPHSANNEAYFLRQALERLDSGEKNGKIEQSETSLKQSRFRVLEAKVKEFKRLVKKCDCQEKKPGFDAFKINLLHSKRIEILKLLKVQCQEDCG